MNFLPANLSALSALAATETFRYSLTALSLSFNPDGSYEVVATNGRYLGHVKGPAVDPETVKIPAATATAPNSATTALIPAKDWEEAFKAIPKKEQQSYAAPHNGEVSMPMSKRKHRFLAVVPAEKTTVLASTDGRKETAITSENVDGRFPDYKQVFPAGVPAATVTVDPALLITLLKTASAILDVDSMRVTLEFYKDGAPIGVRCKNAEGQEFHGLLVPLSK